MDQTNDKSMPGSDASAIDGGQGSDQAPPMKWYVVQVYSGYEQKVKLSLAERVKQAAIESDFGEILITYTPGSSCIELKSLKYYLQGYRNQGIFYEAATNRILDDLVAACQPKRMRITGAFTARGGISTTVVAEHGY